MSKQQQRKDSGKEDKHEHGVGFLVHKDIVNTIMGCRPVSSRLITKHTPQHQTTMTTKQKNSMTSYRMSLIRHRRRTFLLYKETGMQNWAGMLVETGKTFMDPSAMMTQMRGLRHLEFATFNDLVLANTFGHHKASRRWKWHSPNGQHHNQIDYMLVRKRFQNMKFSRSRHWK